MGVTCLLEKARMITLGYPDLLVTVDHLPLITILGERSLTDIPSPRLYRMKERCLRFKFKIQHCPGKDNKGLDCMSRIHNNEEEEVLEYDEDEADNKLGAAISACHIASITKL